MYRNWWLEAANKALEESDKTGCNLTREFCPTCPVTANNPTGSAQSFGFCVADASPQFGWNVQDDIGPGCTAEDAKAAAEQRHGGATLTDGLMQRFPICTTCPNAAPVRSEVSACTEAQAIDMEHARRPAPCTSVRCP